MENVHFCEHPWSNSYGAGLNHYLLFVPGARVVIHPRPPFGSHVIYWLVVSRLITADTKPLPFKLLHSNQTARWGVRFGKIAITRMPQAILHLRMKSDQGRGRGGVVPPKGEKCNNSVKMVCFFLYLGLDKMGRQYTVLRAFRIQIDFSRRPNILAQKSGGEDLCHKSVRYLLRAAFDWWKDEAGVIHNN